MIELNHHVLFKRSLPTLTQEQIVLRMSEEGYAVASVDNFSKDISAVTNSVFRARIMAPNSTQTDSIIKISQPSEPREISAANNVGGWTPRKLENELKLLYLVNRFGIPSPIPIYYGRLSNGECLAETVVDGVKCTELRVPSVDSDEFAKLEYKKGEVLANIGNISHSETKFGTLDSGARRFATWREYFLTKVVTTLSTLYGLYPMLNNLQHYHELAQSENEWKNFLENVAIGYSADSITELLNEDSSPTIAHGDFWDGNIMAKKDRESWSVSVIDFERGGIEGRSFDLALWLSWKIGGKTDDPDPITASKDFLTGFKDAGGKISPDILKYSTVYGLWQYLDFLVLDTLYGIDRTDESVYEIKKLYKNLAKI